ncbi:DUF4158 domain-containing protein [Actinomadura luteofluorescens]
MLGSLRRRRGCGPHRADLSQKRTFLDSWPRVADSGRGVRGDAVAGGVGAVFLPGHRELVQDKRRDHNRLGFAVQLTSVRFLSRFMADPRQVPPGVAEYLAEQLDIADASCLKLYGERDGTARTHAGEIQKAEGWRDFAAVAEDLREHPESRPSEPGRRVGDLVLLYLGWASLRRMPQRQEARKASRPAGNDPPSSRPFR